VAQVGNAPAVGFRIPKFWHIHACRATTSRRIVKGMVRGHSARRTGLVRYLQGLSNHSGGISKGAKSAAAGFRIPKFRHIHACRATTSRRMVKRMARGDSAHQIDPVRYLQGLSKCSGGISNGGNAAAAGIQNSEIWAYSCLQGHI